MHTHIYIHVYGQGRLLAAAANLYFSGLFAAVYVGVLLAGFGDIKEEAAAAANSEGAAAAARRATQAGALHTCKP